MKKSKIIGILFMLLSFGFIIREVLRMDISSLQIEHPVQAIVLIALFTVVTIGSVVLAAMAWANILSAIHGDKIEFVEIFKVYVKANVAKYLPGNVLHYAGRNVIGSRLGWKHSDILLSSILEVLMILISAAIFLILFAYRQFVDVIAGAVQNAASNPVILPLVLAVLIAGAAGILFLLYKRRDLLDKLKLLLTARFLKVLAVNFVLYTGTFLVQGLVMTFIFTGIFQAGSIGIDKVLLVISSAVLSWFAGFITPGAPGGLGVKEAVLILMLSSVYGREYTLAAALLHRLISVIADAAAFGIGLITEKSSNKPH
jgi:uncharacterized membrane protein YbhN (UPF0104 family)